MKTLSLKISTEGLKLNPEDSKMSTAELVAMVIKNVMLGWGQQQPKGMQEEDRRLFYKICDALEKAVKDKVEAIDLEDTWMGFIRKCKKEIGMNPNELIRRIEELIENVKDR